MGRTALEAVGAGALDGPCRRCFDFTLRFSEHGSECCAGEALPLPCIIYEELNKTLNCILSYPMVK